MTKYVSDLIFILINTLQDPPPQKFMKLFYISYCILYTELGTLELIPNQGGWCPLCSIECWRCCCGSFRGCVSLANFWRGMWWCPVGCKVNYCCILSPVLSGELTIFVLISDIFLPHFILCTLHSASSQQKSSVSCHQEESLQTHQNCWQ